MSKFSLKSMLALAVCASVVAPTFVASATAAPATVTSPVKKSWVSLKASTDKTSYLEGQPIQVVLRATNDHTTGAYLKFSSSQRFDIWIFPETGKESVYSWSAARMFMQSLGHLWLKPGQTQEFNTLIEGEMGTLKPGKYRLEAKLTNSTGNTIAEPIFFEVKAATASVQ